ncbi:E3 ubiquitin-protein ligase TRIM7-like [Eublepharis macularius]|uniref:E3 ubiquitin-protein ligase TRIM7-like n=1 Tax=Eublepharis macularius TaxID=481883 RepID=A0AA97JC32_EUBMA|nr:E3 ubiquitin-protein ligase TRIM7-like [Eublepharis macularius]
MACGGPVKELCEEATCSVCLEYFKDPVTIAECGHNFCRGCLTQSWGESGAEASCPQCRGIAQPKNLRQNLQLANVAAIAKKFPRQVAQEAEGEEGVCEKHGEPLRLFCKDDEEAICLVCGRSREHKDHEVAPLGQASQEYETIVAAVKETVCQKHQEPLKLFCQDDEAPICVVCVGSEEHKDHEILPIEEVFQEYKDQFYKCLEILKKERKRILAYKANLVKESQDLLKQTKGQWNKTVNRFKKLHSFLEEQEKLLLAQMEEMEKEVARRRDKHLVELSEELSSLESLIQDMEEKIQQPASEVLQAARSTLQRYEEKETFEDPVTFPLALKWRIWDFWNINPLLEGIMKQYKDTLDSGFHLQKANVILDPDTAHPELILSADQKSVRRGGTYEHLPKNPERFDQWGIVLGREGFTAGQHFWEVSMQSKEEWAIGVARKSVKRQGKVIFKSKEGIWAVGKWSGEYRASIEGHSILSVSGELKRIRVCLNYAGGQVAFFNADGATLLYKFSGASFSGETLLPLFWVRSEGHLSLSS